MFLYMDDTRGCSAPTDWFPGLFGARTEDLLTVETIHDGYAIRWPKLGEYLYVSHIIDALRERDLITEAWDGP